MSKLRALAGRFAPELTRDLSHARVAVNDGELVAALCFVQEARRVAVAQRASVRLSLKTETNLRVFASAAGTS